jgi:hypothetical protein
MSNDTSKIDAVACEIGLMLQNGKSLGFLCVYRPPNISKDEDKYLYDVMNAFLNYKIESCVIVGDFNFPDIRWPNFTSSHQSDTFLTFYQDHFLTQYVSCGTRMKSNAILDLIFTTSGTQILDLSVNEELGNSDHSIIQFSTPKCPIKTKRVLKKRNLNWIDCKKFANLLMNFPKWSDILRSNDVNHMWDNLLSHINSVLDVIAPYRVI